MSCSFNIEPYCDASQAVGRMLLIKTDRTVLEPLVEAHAPELFLVLSDPVIKASESGIPSSVDVLRAQIRLQTDLREQGNALCKLCWGIRLMSGELVGVVDARNLADASSVISCLLASAHWKKGYASEAVKAVMHELSIQHRVREFYAVIRKQNQGGHRLLRRLGYTLASPDDHRQSFVLGDELLFSRAGAVFLG